MPMIGEQIDALAFDLLRRHPDGLRYTELRDAIVATNSSYNPVVCAG